MSARTGSVKHVTSTANPLIKAVRALHQRKARAESGLFLAEGHKLVLDALAAGWTPTMIVAMEPATDAVSDLGARVRALGADVVFANAAVMEKVARRENPQTVIGVFEQHLADPKTMPAGTIVALEEPRDPGNVGTIIRTADAIGAAGVILIGSSADPFGVEAVRATMGSIFHMPLARMDADAFARFAAARPGPMIGTHLAGSVDIRTIDAGPSHILLMGTEQSGLTAALAQRCDSLVRIPMAGKADSFNLAIATAIGLYELRRPHL
ncbi:RNA methyltransferase [Acuticoccus sp. I52.16.1]|uniref:TrmH family RNA methyltransferase n=1 Tax=Acuticoccus sp. I52.16.1 TaxID=2928472 RepID=UPI001FD491F9|nr:RNA methyltransferase [Acuticoccus sp. I52.16.1]UOM36421.1 RNA methyltransferase [Acuticoccus sp. I52.16.1]